MYYPSLMHQVISRRLFASRISSIESYEILKSSPPKGVLVGWFHSRHSLACKMYESSFIDMEKKFPDAHFFSIDVDEVPTAAYDAEVVDVPQVVVMPIGKKLNGILWGREDWTGMRANGSDYTEILKRAEHKISEKLKSTSEEVVNRKWQFDPATGGSMPV